MRFFASIRAEEGAKANENNCFGFILLCGHLRTGHGAKNGRGRPERSGFRGYGRPNRYDGGKPGTTGGEPRVVPRREGSRPDAGNGSYQRLYSAKRNSGQSQSNSSE